MNIRIIQKGFCLLVLSALLGVDARSQCFDWDLQMATGSASRGKVGEPGYVYPTYWLHKDVSDVHTRTTSGGGYSLVSSGVQTHTFDTEGHHYWVDTGTNTVTSGGSCYLSDPSLYLWTNTESTSTSSGDPNTDTCDYVDSGIWTSYYTYAVGHPTDTAYNVITDDPAIKSDTSYHAKFQWTHSSKSENRETTVGLSIEYTTKMLLDKLAGDLSSAMGRATNWGGNSSGWFSLGDYGLSASAGGIKWRFKIVSEKGIKYKAKSRWMIVYNDGVSKPVLGDLIIDHITGNGGTVYGPEHMKLPNMDKDCDIYVTEQCVDLDDGTDNPPDGSKSGCTKCKSGDSEQAYGAARVASSATAAGSGSADFSGVPSFFATMGNGLLGDSAGGIQFSASDGTSNMANPLFVNFSDPNGLSDAIYDTNNILFQVKSPQGLAQLVITNDYKFAIDFYSPDVVGGKTNNSYYHTGSPYVSWVFENPDTTNANNHLNIYEVRGASITTNSYTWSTNYWEALLGNGLSKRRMDSSWNSGTSTSTETYQILDPSSNTVIEQKTTKHLLYGGRMLLVEEKNGNDPSTTYTYDADGWVTDTVRWDGSWESRSYVDGNPGLLWILITGWQSNSLDYTENANRYTIYDYTSYDADDDLSVKPRSPRWAYSKTLGVETGNKYTMFRPNVREDRLAQFDGVDQYDSYNLISIKTNYSSGTFADYPLSISNSDGTMDVFYYETNSTSFVTTQLSGEAAASSPKTNIVNGTKTITTLGLVGEFMSELRYDLASGILISSKTCTNFDAFRRPLRVYYLDGTYEGFGYGCCNIETKTNRDGTMSFYSFDALKRLYCTTEQGISLINVYDAADRVLSKVRQGTNGSSITLFTRGYTLEGRVSAETNALGGIVLNSQGFNGSGELLVTNYFVDTGASKITRTAKDGSVQEVSGTASFPTRFLYGVGSTGDTGRNGPGYAAYQATVKLTSGGGTNEWTKSFTDMVGRRYKMIFAATSGAPTWQSYYNSKGQQIAVIDPDGVEQLHQFDTRGRLEYSVVDIDRNGTIDKAGTDRITQTQRDVVNDGTVGNIVRERRFVWDTASSNTSNLVSTLAYSTDGLTTWNVAWNGSASVTNKSVTSYPSTGTKRVTLTYPNGATRITDLLSPV